MRMGMMWLAVVGMILPSMVLGAPPAINPSTRPTQTVRDIALGQGGILSGKVLDPQGKAISNVPIQVQREGHLIAHVVTDTSGQFSVGQLTGGIYSISTPNQQDSKRFGATRPSDKIFPIPRN